MLNNTKIEKQTDIPFPQADKFERVINLCELLNSGDYDHDMITQKYDFDGRQTNYYISAGRYLGLIENHKRGCPYELSNNGKAIQKLKYKQRQLSYCQKILSHEIFNKVIRLYFERGQIPEKNEIIKMMKSLGLHNINSDTTFFRRASTISSWVEWIVKLIQ